MIMIEEIRCGRRVPFGPNGEPSAIAKERTDRAVDLQANGVVGDEQGDTRNHGGAEKALHHYPADHYAYWRAREVRIAAANANQGRAPSAKASSPTA